MNSKLATYGTMAIIILFLISTFAVILYVPTLNSTNTATPTPGPSSAVNFSGTGTGSATIENFTDRFVVQCNSSTASADLLASAIDNLTVVIQEPQTSTNPSPANGTNSSNATSPSTTTLENVTVKPFASALAASGSVFVAMLNGSVGENAASQLGSQGLFFDLQLGLSQYCTAQVVRDALVDVSQPVTFQSDGQTAGAPSNYTVYPLDFQGYAAAISQSNGGPAFVHAFVLPNAQLNSNISFEGNVQVTNGLLTSALLQQYLGQNDLNPTIISLPAKVLVLYYNPSSVEFESTIPWQYRDLVSPNVTGSALNTSPYFTITSYSYSPYDSITVDLSNLPNDTNSSLIGTQIGSMTFVESVSPSGSGNLSIQTNSTNSSLVLSSLAAIGVPASSLAFPDSTLLFPATLSANATAAQGQSFIEATLQEARNTTVLESAQVQFTDLTGASTQAGAILPSQFGAFVNPLSVGPDNTTNVTVTAISEQSSIVSIAGQSQ